MTMEDFKQILLHAKNNPNPTMLEDVAEVKMITTPRRSTTTSYSASSMSMFHPGEKTWARC